MKKILLLFIATTILSISAPTWTLLARRGHRGHHGGHHHGGSGAGLAIGLIGSSLLMGIASNSGSDRASAAQREAIEARREAERIRREGQREKIYKIEQRIERQYIIHKSGTTFNMLIFAIVMLFLGLIGLSIIVLRRKGK